jgi:6-phosphogluconolactonase
MRGYVLLASLFLANPALAGDVLYVSVAGEKRIALWAIDAKDGHLSAAWDLRTTGEPGALTTDPRRRFLFAALRSTGELAAFRIDSASGKLTHINTVPAGADPAHLSTDKAGKYLLTAYYVAGKVTVHAIAEDGSISREPLQTFKTKEKAHAVVIDPSEWAVLVPHTGPNVTYVLHWDRKAGKLSEMPFHRSVFEAPQNGGPRHVVFHPTLVIHGGVDAESRVAYVVNEQGGSVTMYHGIFNPINWLLQPKQTIATLPKDFGGTNACAEIRLHPSNRYLYVSNRGHDSIAGFRVDQASGELTGLDRTPTEKTPRSFDIDPSGRFLFAAGEASGRLAGYRIDQATGKLERIATYDVGDRPWWVMAVRLPGN